MGPTLRLLCLMNKTALLRADQHYRDTGAQACAQSQELRGSVRCGACIERLPASLGRKTKVIEPQALSLAAAKEII